MRSKVVRRGWSVVVVGALVVLAACSSTSTQVSDEIAAQVKDELDLSTEPGVTCPEDAKAEKGETFTCEIDLAGETVPIDVTFKDDTNFTSEVQGAVYKKATLDEALQTSLGKGGVTVKSFDCEGGDLIVLEEKASLNCTVTAQDGSTADVKIVLDEDNKANTAGAVYSKVTLIESLIEQFASQDVAVSSMDCGEPDLIQAVEDTTIECQAVDADGAEATVEVALGQDGTAKIENVITD